MNEPLSAREIEILRLAADGCANGEIAVRLSLSLNTIKWYSKRIHEKLGVESRVQAIKQAQNMGLLDSSGDLPPPLPNYVLPRPLTAFVGRRAEVDAVKQLLRQHRLLTLTGPGGIGKTRLALQVAEEVSALFRDGVCFVDLAAVNETHLVINSIAYALGVAESLDAPLVALTQAFLRDRHLLLVLDNFEHLIWAAPVVAALQHRHAYYYTQLAAHLESPAIKQQLALQHLESENDNFRVALRWSLAHDPEPGLNLIGDLGSCWRIRGRLTEGMTWAQQLLAAGQQAPAPVVLPPARARAYASAAVLSYVLGHRRQACQLADQGWLLAQSSEDLLACAQTTFVRAAVLVAPNLTPVEYEEIVRLTHEAAYLFLTLKNPMNYARTFNLLGEVKRMQQCYTEAIPHYAESLRGLRAVEYQSGVAIVLANMGWATYHLGDYRSAFAQFIESVDLAYDLGFVDGVAVALIGAAGVLTRLEEPHQAAQFLGAAEASQAALGMGVTAADEPDYRRTRLDLQAHLGPADFDRCWQAGRALTVPAAAKLVHDFSSAHSMYA
ncbi:MAG: LuxR C-terminal-related transcriptional regulator [Caldilineaceae bacterium]